MAPRPPNILRKLSRFGGGVCWLIVASFLGGVGSPVVVAVIRPSSGSAQSRRHAASRPNEMSHPLRRGGATPGNGLYHDSRRLIKNNKCSSNSLATSPASLQEIVGAGAL